MAWVLAAAATWLVVAFLIAVLVGRGIRVADRAERQSAPAEPHLAAGGDPSTSGSRVARAVVRTASAVCLPRPRPSVAQTNRERRVD
jgi:hypothetical protein